MDCNWCANRLGSQKGIQLADTQRNWGLSKGVAMSAHSVRIRVAVVVVMLCVAMLLTGCDWLTGFESFLNNGDIPVSNSKPAKPTEDPGPLYDTDEAPVVESAASEAPIFDNQNILAVQNGGTSPIFKVATASVIT